MENNSNKSFNIVLRDGEYMELYTRPYNDEPDLNRRVKKRLLENMGLSAEEIETVVDSVDLEFTAGGADGEFDDMPYTPCRLVKKIHFEPITPVEPTPFEPEEAQESLPVSQLMLEQYYGDAKKERSRNEAFKRYKSHVGKKTIDVFDEKTGETRSMEIYGVLDYTGKANDTRELRITGFETRLEKLSRAVNGDFSLYETQLSKMTGIARREILDAYEAMRETDPELATKIKEEAEQQLEDLNSEENRHKMIQALIDQDTEFIETNNYSYNSRQHVQEHLKTLGKHGEQSIKHAITKDHTKFEKAGLHVMNSMISLRNTIKAPVHKAVGTYVAAPIHRLLFRAGKTESKGPTYVDGYEITPIEDMLATSQKRSAGAFKNKPTHRYQARKSYFAQLEQEQILASGNASPITLKNKIANIYHMAIVPRVKAITNYREGNIAVLNAGAYDEMELSRKRRGQMDALSLSLRTSNRKIEMYENDIEQISILLKHAKSPEQKVMLEQTLQARKKGLLQEQVRRNEVERTEIDDVPVDSIGLSDHDKAVKSDMTKTVTGVKTAARVVGGMLISRYIYDEIPGKDQIVEEEIFHPATKEPDQVILEAGLTEEQIAGLSFDNLDSGVARTLMHDTYDAGARKIERVADELRGVAFEYNGAKLSGADIGAMSINPNYAGCLIDQPLNGSTSIQSVVKEILEDSTGKSFTDSEVAKMIASGEITNVQRCLSSSSVGIPSGWEAPSSTLQEIIASGSHEVIIPGKEIPAYIETVYKVVAGNAERVINTPAAMALSALGAGQLSDMNDLLRHTRSEPGKIRMLVENEKARIENEKARAAGDESVPQPARQKVPLQKEVKTFQRNTKPKARRFSYQANIPGFNGFHGTKRKDLGRHGKLGQAGYNENELSGFADEPISYDDVSSKRKKQPTEDLEI